MKSPPPAFCKCGSACFMSRRGPRKSTCQIRSICRSKTDSRDPGTKMAALFTTMSKPPNCSTVSLTPAAMLSGSLIFITTGIAVPPCSLIESLTVCIVPGSRLSVTSVVRAATATFAPALARYLAMYSPIPRLAPATKAVRPSRLAICPPFKSYVTEKL